MTEKSTHFSSFSEIISQAPEFKKPFRANTPFGIQEWPFKKVEPKKGTSSKRAIFEAKSSFAEDTDTDPMLVRVSYEEDYGLQAKKTIALRRFPDSELLMTSGEIRYSFGEVDIVLAANLNSPFVTEGILSDPKSFEPTISVIAGDKPIPPIAYVEYQPSSRIPINAQFPCADFQEALNGEVEKREKHPASYKQTYFQWEELVGAKVGITRYDNPNYPDWLQYYRWVTRINSRESVQLEGSPYKGKISWSHDRGHWGDGRLRFSRMNPKTGEAWMFSVPEWINQQTFHENIQHEPLRSFFWQYPVIFCVKRRGEDRKWFSTYSNKDLPR